MHVALQLPFSTYPIQDPSQGIVPPTVDSPPQLIQSRYSFVGMSIDPFLQVTLGSVKLTINSDNHHRCIFFLNKPSLLLSMCLSFFVIVVFNPQTQEPRNCREYQTLITTSDSTVICVPVFLSALFSVPISQLFFFFFLLLTLFRLCLPGARLI